MKSFLQEKLLQVMNHKYLISFILIILLQKTLQSQNQNKRDLKHSFKLELEGEDTFFLKKKQLPTQKNNYASLALNLEYSIKKKKSIFSFNPFFRFDYDDNRNHGDIRELYYKKKFNRFDVTIGAKEVFWGVSESNNLVDIINQIDFVESFDGEHKLGQPMCLTSVDLSKAGKLYFFYLPYHRKRIFPSTKGRLTPFFQNQKITYDSSVGEWNSDFATRWEFSRNSIDIGISYFKGSGREPFFIFNERLEGIYPLIEQFGLDFQLTRGSFLWKLEAINRQNKYQNFFALVFGGEYSSYNIIQNTDLTLFCEYSYDDREKLSPSTLDNDCFFGAKLTFNDVNNSSINLSLVKDFDISSKILRIEASRNLNQKFTIKFKTVFFENINESDIFLLSFENQDLINLSLSYFL